MLFNTDKTYTYYTINTKEEEKEVVLLSLSLLSLHTILRMVLIHVFSVLIMGRKRRKKREEETDRQVVVNNYR